MFFLELSCFFYDPTDVGNLISGYNIWGHNEPDMDWQLNNKIYFNCAVHFADNFCLNPKVPFIVYQVRIRYFAHWSVKP